MTDDEVNLSIDSDNNNGYDNPDLSDFENTIENSATRPGKQIIANLGDKDGRCSRYKMVMMVIVPVRILVAFVAELTLYGFWLGNRRFAELLGILERLSAMVLDDSHLALWIVGRRWKVRAGSCVRGVLEPMGLRLKRPSRFWSHSLPN